LSLLTQGYRNIGFSPSAVDRQLQLIAGSFAIHDQVVSEGAGNRLAVQSDDNITTDNEPLHPSDYHTVTAEQASLRRRTAWNSALNEEALFHRKSKRLCQLGPKRDR